VVLTTTVAGVPAADVTVIGSEPTTPSTLALTVAWPAAMPVTTPRLDTDATLGDELDQVTVRPLSGALWPSSGVAVICAVCPTLMDVVVETSETEATGTTGADETDSEMLPVLPSLVAVTVALPVPTACTRPAGDTVTTPRLELDQAIVRPLSVLPCASFKVTLMVCD